MRLIWKQIIVGLVISIITTINILSLTFFVFPLENWTDLWHIKVIEIPYVVIVGALSILIGIVSGISIGLSFHQKLHHISTQLEDLINGQKIDINKDFNKEWKRINQQILEIDEKMKKQAEQFQKIATERAVEREQSLQEVVLQERNRLARDLHDAVSQQLFAASMMMSAINEGNAPQDAKLKKQLQMVERMIHQSQMEMRALLLHLRPVALKGKSLQEGVEELLMELTEKVPMKVEWKVESFTLDKGIEDQLYRILQEAVSNTLRHSNAEFLQVLLILRDDNIILRIVDDGIGFNVEEAKASSYGLQNMHERALDIGGTLKIVSLENQGTKLEVKVPYVKKETKND